MTNSIEEKKRSFHDQCAKSGLKVTPQRTIIYEELIKAKDHPSAKDLYERVRRQLPNISFDTVYRTLLSFSELGLAHLVEGYGELKRFDPDVDHHHHLRCIKCQKIIDFNDASYDAIKIPSKLKDEFEILNKKVVLEGICKACKKKG